MRPFLRRNSFTPHCPATPQTPLTAKNHPAFPKLPIPFKCIFVHKKPASLSHFSAYWKRSSIALDPPVRLRLSECQAVIDASVCVSLGCVLFLIHHVCFPWSGTTLVLKRRGSPEAPITHHPRTCHHRKKQGTKRQRVSAVST